MIVKLSSETKHGQQTERTRNYNIVTYLSEADILMSQKLMLRQTLHTNMQWPSGNGAGFPIQGSRDQNYWVSPTWTKPFILPRVMEWVLEPSGDLVVKSKLSPHSGVAALRQLNPIHKEAKKFFFSDWEPILEKQYWNHHAVQTKWFQQCPAITCCPYGVVISGTCYITFGFCIISEVTFKKDFVNNCCSENIWKIHRRTDTVESFF